MVDSGTIFGIVGALTGTGGFIIAAVRYKDDSHRAEQSDIQVMHTAHMAEITDVKNQVNDLKAENTRLKQIVSECEEKDMRMTVRLNNAYAKIDDLERRLNRYERTNNGKAGN